MGKRFERELDLRDKVMALYLGLSFVVGLSILFCLPLSIEVLLLDYPLSVLFCALPAYLFLTQKSNLSYLSLLASVEFFFIGHYLCLLGMCIELSHAGLHYMSVIPALALMSQILNNWTLSKKEKIDHLSLGLGCVILSFPLPFLIKGATATPALTYVLILSFFSWQLCAVFFAHFQVELFSRKLSSLFSKKTGPSSSFSSAGAEHPLLKERYFFHDLINHTHAMDLSLRYRLSKQEGLSLEQTGELSQQLHLLQALVKEHFGFGHKNLIGDQEQDQEDFSKLFFINDTLIKAFLPLGSVKSYISIKDPMQLKDRAILPLSSWQRVLTNLIKNAAEAGCSVFEVGFFLGEESLIIETKNDFFHLNHADGELGSGLARVIEKIDHTTQSGPGLGLEAIHLLCEENEGSFDFSIKEGFWCSRVEMNYASIKDPIETSNLLNLHKKAS